ncbi:Catabolic 3-dehydroquinase [Pleurostoma richardsiae]|uniref:Catabolic 3-dehydroquinase n=1 Tax=Pleurostoma richardsiae TaxID=41990 RepID=A0AA38R7T1_9PEZI|nr:Catabolic 3-dehydroquinase [Pleurostoma richardsiae]
MSRRILLINGPNLNLLGTREPAIYGSTTLADVLSSASAQAAQLGVELEVFQSNHEGAIVDRIQEAGGFGHFITTPKTGEKRERVDAIIINPGAFTHTSVALRDALLGVSVPFVEVHVSNLHAREPWRHHSYFSDKAVAVIAGLGAFGYTAAIEFAAKHLKVKKEERL